LSDLRTLRPGRQLYVAFDRGYITNDELDAGIRLAEKTSRLIAGFIAYLQSVTG
jgi:hypothetical protein